MPLFGKGFRIGTGPDQDRWLIVKKLGEGQFAEVYEVKDMMDAEKRYALKIERRREVKSVKQEFKVLKKIQERLPNLVCTVHSCGTFEERFFMIMELLGNNLVDARRTAGGRFDLGTARVVASRTLMGLEEVHAAGFVHRDVKPANFAVGPPFADPLTGVWKVIDFGLARRYLDDTGEVLPQRTDASFRGSTTYASIHAHAEEDLGRRDDLWSWLYCTIELLEGTLPWRTDTGKDPDSREVVERAKHACIQEPARYLRGGPCSPLLGPIASLSNYIAGLGFGDAPDYAHLAALLGQLPGPGPEDLAMQLGVGMGMGIGLGPMAMAMGMGMGMDMGGAAMMAGQGMAGQGQGVLMGGGGGGGPMLLAAAAAPAGWQQQQQPGAAGGGGGQLQQPQGAWGGGGGGETAAAAAAAAAQMAYQQQQQYFGQHQQQQQQPGGAFWPTRGSGGSGGGGGGWGDAGVGPSHPHTGHTAQAQQQHQQQQPHLQHQQQQQQQRYGGQQNPGGGGPPPLPPDPDPSCSPPQPMALQDAGAASPPAAEGGDAAAAAPPLPPEAAQPLAEVSAELAEALLEEALAERLGFAGGDGEGCVGLLGREAAQVAEVAEYVELVRQGHVSDEAHEAASRLLSLEPLEALATLAFAVDCLAAHTPAGAANTAAVALSALGAFSRDAARRAMGKYCRVLAAQHQQQQQQQQQQQAPPQQQQPRPVGR